MSKHHRLFLQDLSVARSPITITLERDSSWQERLITGAVGAKSGNGRFSILDSGSVKSGSQQNNL